MSQAELGGRQGRLALVHLVVERHRPVPIDELAVVLWGDTPPRTWEPSLRVVISKLRATLGEVTDGRLSIERDGGCYQAAVGEVWVDIEAAANAVDRAEGAWRRGEVATTWSEAAVAAAIARRPLLPGEDRPWIDALRTRLRAAHVRALDLLVRVHLGQGDRELAVALASDLVELEPYREESHRLLMRAYVLSGERAEAIRVYGRLRDVLAADLGIDPSPQTAALYLDVLRSEPAG